MMMRNFALCQFMFVSFIVTIAGSLCAQNPFILDQFTADPAARVFAGRVYVYPSHDIPCSAGRGRIGWFCMQDYHVFSSSDLTDWTDHGVIVSQSKVDWVDSTSYSMWAPDCIYKNENMLELASEPQVIENLPDKGLKEGPYIFERSGIYYLTYPHVQNKTERLEYAIGDTPIGPFKVAGVIMDESATGCWTSQLIRW